MNYLCKNYPKIMRSLLFIALITGIGTIVSLLCLLFVYRDEFVMAHKEIFNYVFTGKTDE